MAAQTWLCGLLSVAWSAFVAVMSQELALTPGACEVCPFITVL